MLVFQGNTIFLQQLKKKIAFLEQIQPEEKVYQFDLTGLG